MTKQFCGWGYRKFRLSMPFRPGCFPQISEPSCFGGNKIFRRVLLAIMPLPRFCYHLQPGAPTNLGRCPDFRSTASPTAPRPARVPCRAASTARPRSLKQELVVVFVWLTASFRVFCCCKIFVFVFYSVFLFYMFVCCVFGCCMFVHLI